MTDDHELELLSYKNQSHISCLADNCFLIFDFCQRPTASANAFAHINSAGYAVYFKQRADQSPNSKIPTSVCAEVGALLTAGADCSGAGADCWAAAALLGAGAGSVSRAKIFGWGDSEGEGEAARGVRVPAAPIARPEAGAAGEGETAAV